MEFGFGVQIVRERRKPVTDPYDPDAVVPGSWGDPLDTLQLDGAFIASSSSAAPLSATRSQILTEKSLYLNDPDADVLPGDRVRRGSEVLYVNVRPAADMNPFTGWRPVVEIPLDMSEG